MSHLRTIKWKCSEILDQGACGDVAAVRCNACRKEFCEECWTNHLEMTVVTVAAKEQK